MMCAGDSVQSILHSTRRVPPILEDIFLLLQSVKLSYCFLFEEIFLLPHYVEPKLVGWSLLEENFLLILRNTACKT